MKKQGDKWSSDQEELSKGVKLDTGEHHKIEVPVEYSLYLRLDIDPKAAESFDDRFTLIGGKTLGDREYEQVKTVADDQIAGDEYTDLLFTELKPKLKYWLEIDPGKEGKPYYLFAAMTWEELRPDLIRAKPA